MYCPYTYRLLLEVDLPPKRLAIHEFWCSLLPIPTAPWQWVSIQYLSAPPPPPRHSSLSAPKNRPREIPSI